MHRFLLLAVFLGLQFYQAAVVSAQSSLPDNSEGNTQTADLPAGEKTENKPVVKPSTNQSVDGSKQQSEKNNASEKVSRSPYFYKPTESISEDLSVAFPVDI